MSPDPHFRTHTSGPTLHPLHALYALRHVFSETVDTAASTFTMSVRTVCCLYHRQNFRTLSSPEAHNSHHIQHFGPLFYYTDVKLGQLENGINAVGSERKLNG